MQFKIRNIDPYAFLVEFYNIHKSSYFKALLDYSCIMREAWGSIFGHVGGALPLPRRWLSRWWLDVAISLSYI
jgi:hypothetical protein